MMKDGHAGSAYRNIDQLHAHLMREREVRVQQEEQKGYKSSHEQHRLDQINQDGRDFFVSKRFDVGQFEQDLRNVHNAYKKLEQKLNRDHVSSAAHAGGAGLEGFNRNQGLQQATVKTYRE